MNSINIIEGLEKIIKWRKNKYPEDAYLTSGLTIERLQQLTQGFPFKLPNELSEFYTRYYTNISLAPGLCAFHSLTESLDQCLQGWILRELPDEVLDFSEPKAKGEYLHFFEGCFQDKLFKKVIDYYPHNWCKLPIFYGVCKQVYLIECNKQAADTSPVWVRFIGEEPKIYASSLTSLMLTIAECYETGAYYTVFHEEYGEWEIEEDLEKVELIFEKHNPLQINTWRSIHKN